MTSIATLATNDVGSEVALLGTVVFAVTDLTAILASLILVITKSTVESSKLTKLITLELILTFWDRGGLSNMSGLP